MRGEGEHEKGQVSNLPLREGKYRYYVGGTGGSRTAPTEGREDGVAGRIGGWIPALVFTGGALRGNNEWGWE